MKYDENFEFDYVEIKVHLNENSSWNKLDSNAFNVILN